MRDLLTPMLEHVRSQTATPNRLWQKLPATRIDLHCHSTFSDEHSHWFPRLIYHPLLTPEQSYDRAKARGMDFVTLTDHNTISGCLHLLEQRGDLPDFIVGEEVSTAFPEDRTGIHVNVFDIDEAQHREIQRLRENVYDLVAYLRQIDKLFVLNHMTWTAQHRALQGWQIEAMLTLFDHFEGINGARSYAHNAFVWYATQGRDKTLVGGSDSHTRRVGTTYTISTGSTRTELLANLQAGIASPAGAFGTPEKLREDVHLVFLTDVERRLADATGRWERLTCRTLRRVGRALYPLACRGYDLWQRHLIRGAVRALPAYA